MSTPQQLIKFNCGCTATWNDIQEYYDVHPSCPEHTATPEELAGPKTIIPASRELLTSDICISTSYNRMDRRYCEMTFDLQFDDPMLLIGFYTPADWLHGDPSQGLDIGLLQTVQLRDLLRKPALQAVLESGTIPFDCPTDREAIQSARDSKRYTRTTNITIELIQTRDGISFELAVPTGQALELSVADSVVLTRDEMLLLCELLERDVVCEVLDDWESYVD